MPIATFFRRPMSGLSLSSRYRSSGGFASSSSLQTRLEVCPPAERGLSPFDLLAMAWGKVSQLLTGTHELPLVPDPLLRVRLDFLREVADMSSRDVTRLQCAIDSATSLRDLWHLRSTLFNLVARQHSQCEADARLARLNRHFPTRSPRSGLAPLDALAERARPAR